MHQVAKVDLVVLVKRRRQVVLFDLALPFTGVDGVGLVAQVELLIHRHHERFEAPAALHLQGRLHAPGEPEGLLVLEDVERQRNRCDDAKVLVGLELVRLMDPLEPVLRRPDLVQTQREHGTSQYTPEKGLGQRA